MALLSILLFGWLVSVGLMAAMYVVKKAQEIAWLVAKIVGSATLLMCVLMCVFVPEFTCDVIEALGIHFSPLARLTPFDTMASINAIAANEAKTAWWLWNWTRA